MFVDASAIVAILTREPAADTLADAIDHATSPITSPLAIFEATAALCRKRHASVQEAQEDVSEFLTTAEIGTVPISVKEAEAALDAFARYGKGRGHPAQLNLGDCFAYACAKTHRTSLLFKGDDFSRTDIAPGTQKIAPPE
jgi:ribonuclease VapC